VYFDIEKVAAQLPTRKTAGEIEKRTVLFWRSRVGHDSTELAEVRADPADSATLHDSVNI